MRKLTKIFGRETRKLLKIFSHPTFIYLTIVGNSVLIFATIAVYYLEKGGPNSQIKSYFDALWWGISTITTVGYGDILPQTFPGRLIGIALMYTGTVLFISFTGVLLMTLMKEEVEEEMAPLKRKVRKAEREEIEIEKTVREISKRIERIEKKL